MDPFLQAAVDEAKLGLAAGGIPIGSLENAGRQRAAVYRRCTIYTTLSPCPMCSGAILLYAIPRVVIGENRTFMGAEDHLRASGVKVEVAQNEECVQLMRDFMAKSPQLWNEDIGV